ncbi:CBO0543 family protein (plasmid) [Niallia taxi]|uniref:Uncharacterized protein n=1 Tax=Niallia taxi TaxID=2499688 RepID=A0A437K682_9BACI|nr:CBO0543 family protein [Niallia taxi]MDK8641541.1 CBO0543 family protein [Niallia taxi]MED4056018.1 hypothetical protein [Niallia taxi]MED4120943.1 hypothetical protein [Niallia taxi]RVT58781.1 hypothetical protein EM808_20665 [Niallia taxi]
MSFERWFLIGFTIICIISLFKFVPKYKKRDAWVLFLFLQLITWPAGLFTVEQGWIEYPIQLLPQTNEYNKTSFSFEFFFFPVVAIFFSLYFPRRKNWKIILLYYVGIAGFFTILEVFLERYTALVKYKEWTWYWSFITVVISLVINDSCYKWFKKGFKPGTSE